ncbi:glutaredoxin 3 [Paenibacillus phyllosphaerae]|uniref:Glutaredoxin 3 n=1 Tax=Paenibacillus phyllosphaerae TaxID=274593 RepID=A0A7W5FP33_9BACL|nr:glutaredoxin family protein [Paenibacillus phyllosphaerae]MBB3111792.1 glutaredoxin 3 [Paenibacillus phyllosphaerae]
MKTNIDLYTIPTCSDCNYAKRFFKEHQIPYTEYNCENNVSYAQEVLRLTGKQVVPTLVINDKVYVGFAENLVAIKQQLGLS